MNDIREIPVKIITTELQKHLIEKVQFIIEKTKNSNENKKKFLGLLIDNYDISKISQKLDSFYGYKFKDILTECSSK